MKMGTQKEGDANWDCRSWSLLDSANRKSGGCQSFMGGKNELLGLFPPDASVGDRDAVLQVGEIAGQFLCAGRKIAFDHQPDDRVVPRETLFDDVVPDFGLPAIIFIGICMAAIDHEARR